MRSPQILALAICLCIQLALAAQDQHPYLRFLEECSAETQLDRDYLPNWTVDNQASTLQTGQYLTSQNGQYKAMMQKGGRLAVFDSNNKLVVSAGENVPKSPPHLIIMQPDGNLVIYNKKTGLPTWHSSTYASSEGKQYSLKLENTGALVIYGPGNRVIWALRPPGSPVENPNPGTNPSSGTNPDTGCPYPRAEMNRSDTLENWASVGNRSVLHTGDSLVSLNGEYHGGMLSNGRFQIVNKNGQVVSTIGASFDSSSASGFSMIMQPDGNLCIYNSDSGNPIYSFSTYNGLCYGGLYYARLTNTGKLVIYNHHDTIVYTST